MANLTLSKQPGYYYDSVTLNWVLGSDVSYINYTQNGAQPAISEYIAYDTLTPPQPLYCGNAGWARECGVRRWVP